MGRKVVCAMAIVVIAVVSAGLVGGQVGGFWWWGTHEPIYIYGDDDFTYSNGVMSGSGTSADPYSSRGGASSRRTPTMACTSITRRATSWSATA